MIEILPGIWADPWDVKLIKEINDKSCTIWIEGLGGDNGFVVDFPADQVVQQVLDAREGVDSEGEEEEE